MMVDVYNQQNKKVGKTELPDEVFKVKWNPDLVHQVFVAQIANRRKSIASTKDRSEVRGGGKKPWKQKGTGRARHGSIRSPLWVGGGVTFGPRQDKKFGKKVNKKMKHAALYSLLSKKVSDEEIRVVDTLNLTDHKTKKLDTILRNFFQKKSSVLLVPTKENKEVFLAARNIPKTKALSPTSLNVYDCLAHKYIFFDKSVIERMRSEQ